MNSRVLGLVALVFYCVVRFGFDSRMSELMSYFFEIAFTAIVLILFRARISFRFQNRKALKYEILISFLLGFGLYRLALAIPVVVPFDFTAPKLVFLLLVVAPLLEEFLFRGALWKAFEGLTGSVKATWVLAALLFSFGHFFAYFSVPTEYKSFVVYQAGYTLLLGLWWGRTLMKQGTLWSTVLLHFVLNFGFYLGWRMLTPSASTL